MGSKEQSPLGDRSVAALSRALEDRISLSSGSSDPSPSTPPTPPTPVSDDQKVKTDDEKQDTKAALPKDPVTGRVLAEDPRPCLLCVEKGRKCTFIFADSEDDEQCAACRRQAAAASADDISAIRCVRLSKEDAAIIALDFDELRKTTKGPKAQERVDELQKEANYRRTHWESVVRDHEAERDHREKMIYVNGEPMSKRDVARMALPMPDSFTGKDSGVAGPAGPQTPPPLATRGWKDVLPVPGNRSLSREDADVEELFRARGKEVATGGAEKGEYEELEERDERIKYLQRIRKYQPREMHLSEAQTETANA